ncbi:T9SS type A sorting domain-containing protein [Phnomibacter ginsenosidimutans]|uniref:T9SS type A sorting domain-containing protein n=1 Tax=Phnomibacter ginsenosidimutans TaxID=2676868 RepID=A0A6I6G6Y0_9BACT|nr:T9SS type A sorting domain-containing protein [Phnomibacter ginsenosidimutans]QGW28436.1 T9SS type A sorting domain-containing protein [Phnomibacter ginsenosidimutans]
MKKYISIYLCGLLFVHLSHAQSLKISNGAQLVAKGTATVVLNNLGITNDGNIVPSTSTFIFSGNGTTSSSFIAGSSSSSFYNLSMNKSANGMQLNADIAVSNQLQLIAGDSLFLNNHTIELGTSGILVGETDSKRVTGYNGGYIESIVTLNAPLAVNPGNLGFAITSLSNLGVTTIRRGHVVQGEGSVSRYFDIIPTNNSNLASTSASFHYLHNELNDNNENFLDVFISYNEGESWTFKGNIDLNTTSNFVTEDGFQSFGRVIIGNLANIVLPLRSVTLSGNATPKQFKLHWLAAGITANGVSVIEKSSDGTVFTHVASLPYSVTNGEQQHFNWIDNATSDQVYYRIKAVNQAGKTIYSNVLLLQRGSNTSFQVYPNPARGSIQFIANNIAAKTIDIGIYALNGQLVQQQIAIVKAEKVQQQINIANLPAGIYVIRSAAIPLAQQLFTVY